MGNYFFAISVVLLLSFYAVEQTENEGDNNEAKKELIWDIPDSIIL